MVRKGWLATLMLVVGSCGDPAPPPGNVTPGHRRMVAALEHVQRQTAEENKWLGDKQARRLRAIVARLPDDLVTQEQWWPVLQLGVAELWLGNERAAIKHITRAVRRLPHVKPPLDPKWRNVVMFRLGVAYLRLGVTSNCCMLSMPDSCILPIQPPGFHTVEEGAREAIESFTKVIENSVVDSELHWGARWLLNIAHMYLGTYPQGVPKAYRLAPASFASDEPFPRFPNIAGRAGLAKFSLSGGAVIDDFDNDGYLDIFTTTFDIDGPLPHLLSQQPATAPSPSGLRGRGAGCGLYGRDQHWSRPTTTMMATWTCTCFAARGCRRNTGGSPTRFIRNNGNGTFTDVTFDAGLGEVPLPHTDRLGWADYDNDGDLDLCTSATRPAARPAAPVPALSQQRRRHASPTWRRSRA